MTLEYVIMSAGLMNLDALRLYCEVVRLRSFSRGAVANGGSPSPPFSSVGLHDMSRHMQPFMSAFPHARVLLECLHPHKVVEAVMNDEADLGVLSYPAATRTLNVLPPA